MDKNDLKLLLDDAVVRYNKSEFIINDPICIPHAFQLKEDIEIMAFLTSTIAWGNRKSIILNGRRMAELMDHRPFEFVMGHQEADLKRFERFVHRTFQTADLQFFITSLRNIYSRYGGLEEVFTRGFEMASDSGMAIHTFRNVFFEPEHLERTHKHVSDPMKKSSSKRLNMFLRWMVRNDSRGVDFGLWKDISTSKLCIPLDVHTGNVGRALGLLKRKQNDWTAVVELTSALRAFDPEDPVKYDFALFGMGVNGDM